MPKILEARLSATYSFEDDVAIGVGARTIMWGLRFNNTVGFVDGEAINLIPPPTDRTPAAMLGTLSVLQDVQKNWC